MFNNKRIERLEARVRDLEAQVFTNRAVANIPHTKEYKLDSSIYNCGGSAGGGYPALDGHWIFPEREDL